jgi:hypothetical protein
MGDVVNELKAEGVYFDSEDKKDKKGKRKDTSDSLT